MLQHSLVALGVATLAAAASAVNGAGPIELPSPPEPGPTYLALGGELVELAARSHGPGCFAPMLDQLRRHPHWSIRIDQLMWDDIEGNEPDERRAYLVIDGATAIWRDGVLPQSLALTAAERRDVLAAFALDCRIDETAPSNGYVGFYFGVALGEDGEPVTTFPTSSQVATRLLELFDAIRARHVATRVDELRGFSLELAGTMRDHDGESRPIRRPHRIEFHARGDAAPDQLELQLRLLDWAMTQPTSLPAADWIVRGTLRAHGASRPIALDLTRLGDYRSYGAFGELAVWASIERL